jgi:hypothetical protein
MALDKLLTMNHSESIYILKNFYSDLGFTSSVMSEFRNRLVDGNPKINIVRYWKNGVDSWLHVTDENVDQLDDISNVRTLYTFSDQSPRSESEKNFFNHWKQKSDFHISFSDTEYIKNNTVTHNVVKHFKKAINFQEADITFVLFNWRDPKLCGWHRDGMRSYGHSNNNSPTKCTINLEILHNGYVELEKSDGTYSDTRGHEKELFLFDSHKTSHRIVLSSNTIRSTIALRVKNLEFEDLVRRLQYTETILKIIQ